MSFRITATAVVLTLLGFAAENPASAQPVVPQRPRSSPFQNLFYPRSGAVPNFGAGGGNQVGPVQGGLNNRVAPGLAGQQLLLANNNGTMTPFLVIPVNTQPAVFNSLGHWYSNYYGHWYPNGVSSGMGVLAGSGGGGGGIGGISGGAMGGGVGGPFGSGRYGSAGAPAPVIGIGGGIRR